MKSIRFFLSIVILSTITLMAFVSALNGYRDSMTKAEQLFDSELENKAHLLSIAYSAHQKNNKNRTDVSENGTEYDNSGNGIIQADDFFAFQIWHKEQLLLHSPHVPKVAIAHFEQGFSNRNFLDHRWRVYSYNNSDSNLWIFTAERMDIRYVLAENIVLETIIPVVIMLPFLGILIWSIITYGLSPLRLLAEELRRKQADDLTPLAIEKQPVELIQVVNSTNDLFKRLKASFLREKRFASDAAHELRTPISAIKIHLHNLSHLIPSSEASSFNDSFHQLQLSVDRMGHLVEQILNLNRTSTEQYVTRFTELDIYNLAQDIIVKQYAYFEQKQLKVALEGEHCQIKGDKFSLELLIHNLLTNACKYTPEGGSVLVNIHSDKNRVYLRVEDSGPGVPEEQYARLFDRFYRLNGDCHASGTIGCGLGLAIVQQIVELHHAKISLQPSGFATGLLVEVSFSKKEA